MYFGIFARLLQCVFILTSVFLMHVSVILSTSDQGQLLLLCIFFLPYYKVAATKSVWRSYLQVLGSPGTSLIDHIAGEC